MKVETPVRMQLLEEMVRGLSREPDPDAAAHRYIDAMQEAYGPQALIFLALRDGGYVITRFIDQTGEKVIDSRDLWDGDVDAPVHAEGVLGQVTKDGKAKLITNLDVGGDSVLGDALQEYRTLMALPIFGEGEVRHWLILLHPDASRFDDADLENNLLRANTMTSLVVQKRLNQELQRALGWIRDEVDQIAMVQRSLLPKAMPEIPGHDIAARWETYDRAGGDYYDFLRWQLPEVGDERWTWIVADASGHGPASAVLVAMLHVLLRALPAPVGGPAALLRQMNERLFDCPTCTNFMTAFVGCYRPERRELAYALAGHHPPLLRRASGRVERLAVDPAVPLGVIDHVEAPMASIRLEPGDVLLLYTDGLVDAHGPDDEVFGEARLGEALAEAQGTAQEIVDLIFDRVAAHEAGRRPTDDKTAVVVRVE